jgi:hypothetical protein
MNFFWTKKDRDLDRKIEEARNRIEATDKRISDTLATIDGDPKWFMCIPKEHPQCEETK